MGDSSQMALTISSSHFIDPQLDPSELYEVVYEIDDTKRYNLVEEFIDQYSCVYDRFVFLYSKENKRFEKSIFKRSIAKGKEIRQKRYLKPLVYSDIDGSIDDGIFEFFEKDERLIQKIGLTYDQALPFLQHTNLKKKPTCLVLVNLDRLGYRTSTLLKLYSSLLPYLSPLWGYLFLTQNPRSLPFYHWLALHLGKTATINSKVKDQEAEKSWNLMTIGETLLEQEGDSYLPKKFEERILKELEGVAGMDVLLTQASREIKEFYIQINRSSLLKSRHWHNARRLLLVKIIDRELIGGRKLLVVTNSFDDTSWKEFCTEENFLEYPQGLTPKFWPVADIHQLRQEKELNQYDHILLDFGDELTPWLSTPLLRNILEHTAILEGILANIEVTFFHPILLSREVVEWLLNRPPVPSRLAMIKKLSLRQRELRIITMLLAAVQRTWKHSFYHEINSSWQQVIIDEEKEREVITELVRKLRFACLLERQHFHTTRLGGFFLKYELAINPFLEYLQKNLPNLFTRSLTEKKMSRELFSQFYQTSSEWFFQATKRQGFGVRWLSEFQDALRSACGIAKLTSTLRNTVIDAMTIQIGREIMKQKKQPKIKKYLKQVKTRLEDTKNWNPRPLQGRKNHFGTAFIKTLGDVKRWKGFLDYRERWMFKDPFFLVREHAKKANNPEKGISESSYVRAIYRIFSSDLTDRRTRAYFTQVEKQYPTLKGKVLSDVQSLRQYVALRKVRVTPQRDVLALVLVRPVPSNISMLPSKFEYLNWTCRECWYFDPYRKRDCQLFNSLIYAQKTKVPPVCKSRLKFISNNMVGCPIWRPKEPNLLEIPFNEPIRCVHCFQPLPILRKPHKEYICLCETSYRSLGQEEPKFQLIEYQLSENHDIKHDIAILFNRSIEGINVRRTKRIELQFPPQQIYTPKRNGPLDNFSQNLTQYLFLHASDRLRYDSETNELTIGRKNQPSDVINLKDITFIDSQKKVDPLRTAVCANPHIIINLRKYNLTISPRKKGQDRATIIWEGRSIPVLKVRWYWKRKPEYFPLHQIISVYNVGKPRLSPILKAWGIDVINKSVKGIRSRPQAEIKEALTLKGVQPLLSEIHLLGLVISSIRASIQLIELSAIYNQPALGRKLLQRLKKSLYQAPDYLYGYYQKMQEADTSIILLRCRLEAWISRPFAEGIRQFVEEVQTPNYPLIQRPYGRTFARRLKKQSKQGYDYRGAYTKFDAALNSINRTLRYHLRIWNAKAGLGFYTEPLFSHRSADKTGRAGHLDLEEVGRLISRLILTQAVATRTIHGGQFGVKQDEDEFYYYFPWDWTHRILRGDLVHQSILQHPVWYNRQWLPFVQAHKMHVNHLCNVFRTCHHYSNELERHKYLLHTYTPLIYSPNPLTPGSMNVWDEVRTLFEYCWIDRARKLFQRKNIEINGISHPLIDSQLVNRLLP